MLHAFYKFERHLLTIRLRRAFRSSSASFFPLNLNTRKNVPIIHNPTCQTININSGWRRSGELIGGAGWRADCPLRQKGTKLEQRSLTCGGEIKPAGGKVREMKKTTTYSLCSECVKGRDSLRWRSHKMITSPPPARSGGTHGDPHRLLPPPQRRQPPMYRGREGWEGGGVGIEREGVVMEGGRWGHLIRHAFTQTEPVRSWCPLAFYFSPLSLKSCSLQPYLNEWLCEYTPSPIPCNDLGASY